MFGEGEVFYILGVCCCILPFAFLLGCFGKTVLLYYCITVVVAFCLFVVAGRAVLGRLGAASAVEESGCVEVHTLPWVCAVFDKYSACYLFGLIFVPYPANGILFSSYCISLIWSTGFVQSF